MIAYCPSCYQPSRVPHIDHDVLQCPHCAEEFASHSPNSYVLRSFQTNVEGTLPASGIHSDFNQEVPTNRDINELDIFIEPDEVEDDSEFELQPVDRSLSSRASPNESDIQLDVRPARRKKQKSSIGSFIGVVFGGVAALPIATAILWYGLGTDPLKLAPKVAEYVPWIVPERLLGPSYAQRSTQSSFQETNSSAPNADSHFTDEHLRQANEASPQLSSESFTSKKPEVVAGEPKDAVALPFATDEQPPQVDGKLLLAYASLERSFDAMSTSGDDPTIASFLDSWQRYIDLLPSNDDIATDTQLMKLQDKLVDLKGPMLLKLVSSSRARVANLQPDLRLAYVDAFEIQKIDVQPNSPNVLLVPSEGNRGPIKSMRVLAHPRQFPAELEDVKSQRYLLFGIVKKGNIDGETTLRVLMSRPL